MNEVTFQKKIRDFYLDNYRSMPWRNGIKGEFDPYHITVSEMMLQQTQVHRVIPKYNEFIAKFPDIESLAKASLQEVLQLWTSLGYNRRAKYLHEFASSVGSIENFPKTIDKLIGYKGIGPNTAAAILVYSYNEPHLFIETNVRTVYINCFFADQEVVTDAEILTKLKQTIDSDNPREFYWGLMDYGTYLKKQGKGALSKSKSYKKQSKFAGSPRQLRGKVIKILSEKDSTPVDVLDRSIQDSRLSDVLIQLETEGMIRVDGDQVMIA